MNDSGMIGYCGVDCAACKTYAMDRDCPGCKHTDWTQCEICPPVKCCRMRQIDFCAECREFPCEMMAGFYEESPGHRDAYERMCRMRGSEEGKDGI